MQLHQGSLAVNLWKMRRGEKSENGADNRATNTLEEKSTERVFVCRVWNDRQLKVLL